MNRRVLAALIHEDVGGASVCSIRIFRTEPASLIQQQRQPGHSDFHFAALAE